MFFRNADRENAFEENTLPDALSGIGEAVQAAFGTKVVTVTPTGKQFDTFDGVYIPQNRKTVYVNTNAQVGFVPVTGHEFYYDLKQGRNLYTSELHKF